MYQDIFLKGLVLVFLFCLSSCSSDDITEVEEMEEIDEMQEEVLVNNNLHLITSSYLELDEDLLLIDTVSNRLYLFDNDDKTSIISYDYFQNEIIQANTTDNSLRDDNIAMGIYGGEVEIYFGKDNFVEIYNGDDLTKKSQFKVFNYSNQNEQRFVSNVQFEPPNLLFVSTCNSGNSNNGTMSFNRDSGMLIDQTHQGDHCLASISYTNMNNNEIGLISVSYSTNRTQLILDRFDQQGNVLENKVVNDIENVGLWSFLRDGKSSDYFITDRTGNIISKDDFSKIGTLPYRVSRDIITNQNGTKIISLHSDFIAVHDYPSLDIIERIELKDITTEHFRLDPKRLFIDEGKYIIICYDRDDAYILTHDI